MTLRYTLLLGFILFILIPPVQAQYGYHFGRNKIQYEDFDWHVLRTTHFDVYYYPEMRALAEYGASFAEEVYDELTGRFDYSLNERVPLIFYATNLHFKQTNTTPGFIPDNVGGFFEMMKGRVVLPSNGDIHHFRRVIRHELVHVFTFNKALNVLRDHRTPLDRFMPLWFTEGLAEHWSGEPDHQHEMMLRDAVASNYFVPLDDLESISGSYLMYKEGEALCRFIAETFGEEKLLLLIENIWRDSDFREVMEYVLQTDFRELSERWTAHVQAQYYPRMQQMQVPSLIAGPVAAKGFNAKPVVYRYRDGRRVVLYVGNRTGYTNIYEVAVDEAYRPLGAPEIVVKGERSAQFEAFHLFESRMDVSASGVLAFVTKSNERDVIHLFDLEEKRLIETLRFPDLVAAYSPAWDQAGTKLAFTGIAESGFSDLYLYDTASKDLRQLTHDPYDDRDPAWGRDGITFASDRTPFGKDGAYNLFHFDLETAHLRYLTYGPQRDFAPRWSPDGRSLVYTSTRPDSIGKFDAQNLWLLKWDAPQSLAAISEVGVRISDWEREKSAITNPTSAIQLTDLSAGVYDPVWTEDGHVVAAAFEDYTFSIRHFGKMDSLMAQARQVEAVAVPLEREPWAFDAVDAVEEKAGVPYTRKYALDVAAGGVSQNPLWGTSGGAFIAFSDLMGDDQWFFSLYSTSNTRDDFIRSLNFSISRVELHRRANLGYGIYRLAGLRYDLTDPDVDAGLPYLYETMWGGYGAVSYPFSMFQRVELNTSLTWSDKDVFYREKRRQALLLSNMVSLVHDNALYGMNGPMDGWRGNLSAAYTTDIRFSNVSYLTLSADVRHYWRLGTHVTFASRALAQANIGREARLFLLGGSWDLRGLPLWGMRGQKLWFTSHELRFPILEAPGLYVPVLSFFGIANLRGALFFDAAHAWNEAYDRREPKLNAGETLGATGLGLRLNLFGALVLRYDHGLRFRDGFRHHERFSQFFFGWDF